MEINAGKAPSERPTPSKTDLSPPNWLVRVVRGLIPPGPGSANEIIDVLLETHGSVPQAVLRIPALIAVPALPPSKTNEATMSGTRLLLLPEFGSARSESRSAQRNHWRS